MQSNMATCEPAFRDAKVSGRQQAEGGWASAVGCCRCPQAAAPAGRTPLCLLGPCPPHPTM